jgi:hypothetical protein
MRWIVVVLCEKDEIIREFVDVGPIIDPLLRLWIFTAVMSRRRVRNHEDVGVTIEEPSRSKPWSKLTISQTCTRARRLINTAEPLPKQDSIAALPIPLCISTTLLGGGYPRLGAVVFGVGRHRQNVVDWVDCLHEWVRYVKSRH